jgi:geranylgeranyl reductase family protein
MPPDQPLVIYDVIVVGGGPGGATAAFELGRTGKNVLVLEKEKLPRYKACGGGVSLNLLRTFPFSFDDVIESRAVEVGYILGDLEFHLALPDRPISLVMRDRFDACILEHAQAKVCTGVEVRKVQELDDRVMVTAASGETFTARFLIAADGANSRIARSLGLRPRRRMGAAIEVEQKVPPQIMEKFRDRPRFIFGELGLGYLWIFPKGEHLSIGAGKLHPRPGELQTVLKKIMARYGIKLDGAKMHGHPLPIYLLPERIATRRTLLVGDAAGLMDPLTGEGIRFAIKSGRLAARAVLDGKLGRYSSQVFWQIGINHLAGLLLALIFYTLPEIAFVLAVMNRYVTYGFVRMLEDKTTYPVMILLMVVTLPLHILRTLWNLVFNRDKLGLVT